MTTIVSVRRGDKVVIAGDGQVSLGNTVMKGNARKVRLLSGGKVLAGMGFEYIKLVDATLNEFGRSGTTSFDGFDVDSVSVAPVPLPAAGLMLLAGLGGFGVMRRRQKKA